MGVRTRVGGAVQVGSWRHRAFLAARLAMGWRPTRRRLRGYVRSTITSFLAVGGMLWLFPSLHASGPVSVLVLVVIVFAVGLVVRPLIFGVAVLFGAPGLFLAGVLTQAVILDLALELAPDVTPGPFRDVLVASWVVAAIAALINYIFDVGSDDAFLAWVMRAASRAARLEPSAVGEPGLLIVQIDGLGEDVLRQAMTAGAAPTMSRWLRSGTHRLQPWHTGAPATTPAGQAALLHGDTHEVPGFRWYEKSTRRIMVANHPRDAAAIEHRLSDGRGLLADGGVSVSNLFSGDAPLRLLTMSDPRLTAPARRRVAAFVTMRSGLVRSFILMVVEMVIELQQGRRQQRRDVRPRVSRRSIFVVLRAVTTVLLRNLSVTLVADSLARGAPVVYVDFVDYDEVAHHAGPFRAEAIRTLDGIDNVLRLLEQVVDEMNRRYEIVVLSDHGQAQGEPFPQSVGRSLDEVVAELAGVPRRSAADDAVPVGSADAKPAERWGPANVLLTSAAREATMAGGAARRALHAHTTHDSAGASVNLGPGDHDQVHRSSRPVVAASGSLAHIYLPEVPGRATVEQIRTEHPLLLDGLRALRQVGVVLVRSAAGDLLAFGTDGWRVVTPAGGSGGAGPDPLAGYGPRAAPALAQLDTRAHVGDLVVIGAIDAQLGEVVAFEELVGSHGGVGGGQDRAVLITPTDWANRGSELTGLDVHRLLVDRLTELGLRTPTPSQAVPADDRVGSSGAA
jgi:hypothetical protein